MDSTTQRRSGRRRWWWALVAGVLGFAAVQGLRPGPSAQTPPVAPRFTAPLPDLEGIVTDRPTAIALGKALFWDVQAGSDGMACASCHFSAGADSRIGNALSPGLNRLPQANLQFGAIADYDGEPLPGAPVGTTKSGAVDPDATYQLRREDFPFHTLADERDRESPVVITSDDVASSSGSFEAAFGFLAGKSAVEQCDEPLAGVFHAGKYPARQVEPRNTPTTINAALNFRSFWDGRANPSFNGVGVFGPREIANEPDKRLIVLDESGVPGLASLALPDSSLASQSLAPPLSQLEMSCDGRTFADVGRKLLSAAVRPLAAQRVHPGDSVLGPLVHRSGKGLEVGNSYAALIQKAFHERYWSAKGTFRIVDGRLETVSPGGGVAAAGYSQMETNFSMFWGISIMLYEATLISDRSRFDDWFASCDPLVARGPGDPNAVPVSNPTVTCRNGGDPTDHGLTAEEVLGFALFNRPGIREPGNPACNGCHNIPLLSEAQHQAGQRFVPVERSRIDVPVPLSGGSHDRGFFNIGSRPSSFDPGAGGTDPWGAPLSAARMFLAEQAGETVSDPTGILDRCNTPGLIEPGGTPPYPGCPIPAPPLLDKDAERELVDGSFKTPSLRNVALTPPYFHYGGYSDLRSTLEFYSRGASHRAKSHLDPAYLGDTSGSGPLGKGGFPVAGPDYGTNVNFFIRDLRLTDEQIDALVAFLLTLTDPRVQCDEAPFDHPELQVPVGHLAARAPGGAAKDVLARVPATGAGGYRADGLPQLCLPNSGDLFDPDLRNRLIVP